MAAMVAAAVGLPGLAQADGAPRRVESIGTGARTCLPAPGADCSGVRHRGRFEHHGDLRGARFRGADLRGADLRRADLRRADLRGVNLRGADLRRAKLARADFGPIRARQKRETGTPVIVPSLPGTQPPPACAPQCAWADLAGANLSGTGLYQVNLYSANLSGANLSNASLGYVEITGANLSGADLSGAWLNQVGSASQVEPIDLSGANLSNATLWYVNLEYANLNGTTFTGTSLNFVNMMWATGQAGDVSGATCWNTAVNVGMAFTNQFSSYCEGWGIP